MGKIFCLMGKSSSGKDTIFKELIKDKDLNLKPLIPYTTRPIRKNETNGVEYYFIDEPTLEEFKKRNKVIELREYNTVQGKWYYCTVDDGQLDLENNNYLIITTIEAFKNLRAYFGSERIFPIYIHVDDGIRLARALKREQKQSSPDYAELCRRFLADHNDFSTEVLKENGITKAYENNNFRKCVNSIKRDIKMNM